MPLNIEDALRSELRPHSGQQRTLYLFRCHCGQDLWVPKSALKTRTGECKRCLGKKATTVRPRKRPYEWIYNRLIHYAADRYGVSLTFEEFLEFTKTPVCHYCDSPVAWQPHNSNNAEKGWHLDRKDNDRGYEKDNLVVACAICNRIKNSHLSYEEMLRLRPILHQIMADRKREKE